VIATVRRRALFVVALIGAAAAFLLPQLWLFSLSLKSKAGLFEYPPTWIPRDGSLANYRFVLTHTQVLSDDTAILTAASAREFGAGIIEAFQ